MSISIEEVKEKKSVLEQEILSMLKDFEKEAGVDVTWVNVSVDRGDDRHIPCCGSQKAESKKKAKPKGVYDVNVEVNID